MALEGKGRATAYPGGWSDYAAQRMANGLDVLEKPSARSGSKPGPVAQRQADGLTFTERKRLDTLPGIIDRLESEINKLAELLESADLFTKEPVKFRKASEGMAARQAQLTASEEEWLILSERG